MQAVSSLNQVKSWLKERIASEHIELKRPGKDNKATGYNLVAPAVHVGLVPPNSIVDPTGVRTPCLVVGTPELVDDHDSATMELQITAIVYDPGLQETGATGVLQLSPNFDGYVTLLNFLDRIKGWIQKQDGVAGEFQLESAVRLKTYEEQPWPYWYGFLSFTVSGELYPVTKYADALN